MFLEPMSFQGINQNPKCIFPRKMDNFIFISLPIVPPFENHRITRKVNDCLVFLYVYFFACIFNMKKPILMFYDPRFSSISGYFEKKLVWFEYIDNKLGFTWVPYWMKDYIELIMEKADLVTATSESLYENARKSGARNVHLVKNAVDIDHFNTKKHEMPSDLGDLKRPIIGYSGAISDWFDFDLIEKAAAKFPNSTFLLVGPTINIPINKTELMKKHKNIIFMGKKTYDELPSYISQFDVAIIPFRINPLTNYVNPVKLYEYIAVGKTVVSTALPALSEFKGAVYIADNHEEFLGYIEEALEKKPEPDKYEHILKNNNWDIRARQTMDLLKQYCPEEV